MAMTIVVLAVGCQADTREPPSDGSSETLDGEADRVVDPTDTSNPSTSDVRADGGTPLADADIGDQSSDPMAQDGPFLTDASADSARPDVSTDEPVLDDAAADIATDVSSEPVADTAPDVSSEPVVDGSTVDAAIDIANDAVQSDAPVDAGCPSGRIVVAKPYGWGLALAPSQLPPLSNVRELLIHRATGWLYWALTSPGTIFGVDPLAVPDGGLLPGLFAGAIDSLAIDPDSATIVWSEVYGVIGGCSLFGQDGGALGRQLFAGDSSSNAKPHQLSIHAGEIYWTNPTGGNVLKMSVSGLPDGSTPTLIASGQSYPSAIFVDDSGVYFTDMDDGTVRWAPLDGAPGGVATVISGGEDNPNSVTVYDHTLYWTNRGGTTLGSLRRAVLPIGAPPDTAVPELVVGLINPKKVVVDAIGAYVIANTEIRKVPTGTRGSSEFLACGYVPTGIGTDANWIYWSESTGAVYKTAK